MQFGLAKIKLAAMETDVSMVVYFAEREEITTAEFFPPSIVPLRMSGGELILLVFSTIKS